MTQRNNIITFVVLIISWVGISLYFNSAISSSEESYLKERILVKKYSELKHKYSKESLKQEKEKILSFLGVFDVQYILKKSQNKKKTILSMDLSKSNMNKIISYVLNTNISFEEIKIKKKDEFTIGFKVVFYE